MKVIFICGSLEPGHDGVGDYLRRLAIELSHKEHWLVAALALNDPYITQESLTTQQAADGDLLALRLPSAWPTNKRFARAKQWIDESDADWLSLQFVPFSFHPKGLPFFLGKQLAGLGKGKSWHFMMHELWVGMDLAAPPKQVWWGKIQQYLIKMLLKRLRPKVIHTQTLLYQAQLAALGFSSTYLPLFSNIPNALKHQDVLPTYSETALLEPSPLSLVVFGTIHPRALIKPLAHDAAQYAKKRGVSVVLTMIGRCGAEQDFWAAAWRAAGLPVDILGEQVPARISEVLRAASLGITTTPASLTGKSGTVAAMHEHGLPVLCIAAPWVARGITNLAVPAGIAIYEEGNFEVYLTQKAGILHGNKVSDIANQLASSLESTY